MIKDPQSQLEEIERRLRRAYGHPRHGNPEDPLDDLIFVVLSRMTQDIKYRRTYQTLRETFPSWGNVRDAPVDDIESALAYGGLATTKARHIREILAEVDRREGALSLERLRDEPDEAVEGYLSSLPGVASKTARCVMLYALGRDKFPVDTHVWRICQRLGIVPEGAWSDRKGRNLEDRVPMGVRASLHVTMVALGREICVAGRPRCAECVLLDLCPTGSGLA